MIRTAVLRAAFCLLAGSAALAGCNAQFPLGVNAPALRSTHALPADEPHLHLPPEVLYALGGNARSRTPYIMVFNAQDASPSPAPLYTIPPNGDGEYAFLGADGENNLFAEKYFPNAGKLYMYPAGRTKAGVTCVFPAFATAMYVANGTLFLAEAGDKIVEFAEPLSPVRGCKHPVRILVDERAQRLGSQSLYGVSADPRGDVFDIWQDGQKGYMHMDEFSAGSSHAHGYFDLGQSYSTSYMTFDRNDDLITNLDDYQGSMNDVLAVFPDGSKVPRLFDPTGNGTYEELGLATRESELFVLGNYPDSAVRVYRYDPRTGQIGALKRSFTGLWGPGTSMAVYSP